MPDTRPRMTRKEFQDLAIYRFGHDTTKWKFKCPVCATESTVGDFMAVRGQAADSQRAGQECIGRVMIDAGKTGVQTGGIEPGEGPCNWCSFGLLGTLNGGMVVVMPDGHEMQAFELADG